MNKYVYYLYVIYFIQVPQNVQAAAWPSPRASSGSWCMPSSCGAPVTCSETGAGATRASSRRSCPAEHAVELKGHERRYARSILIDIIYTCNLARLERLGCVVVRLLLMSYDQFLQASCLQPFYIIYISTQGQPIYRDEQVTTI